MQGETAEGTYFEHLEELRWALIRSVIAVTLLYPPAFYFSDSLIKLMVSRLCPSHLSLHYFSPIEPFLVKLKIALFLSVFLALPYIFRQVWRFVSPGLYHREKLAGAGVLLSSSVLSLAGAAFAVFLIIPFVMSFSLSFETPYLKAAIGIDNFISLSGTLIIAFAAVFQMPAVILVLVFTGLVSIDRLKSARAFALVIIMIISAILTPPDVVSQLMMGIPTYLLFELGILVAGIFAGSGVRRNENQVEKKVD